MDTSTIRCTLTQEWSVDQEGNCLEVTAQSPSTWTCLEHGGQPYTSWETVLAHLEGPQHNPAARAATNGQGPTDTTAVGTFHAVELETPDESFATGDWPVQEHPNDQ